jgi:selenocysteine lyase/cysteine desulfurase
MAIAPRDVRAMFPAVHRYAYLNAAASSPLALPVCVAMEAHLRDTVENGDIAFPRWLELKERLRARLGRFLGADASCVAFLPSTSIGFGVIAHLFRGQGITEVLTLEGEFPSTTLPLLHEGLTLKVVKRRPDGSYPLEDIEAALTPATKAIALSAVQYASGYRVDLSQVAALCQIRGLKLAINGAQALGQVPINMTSLGADFICGPSHKWMMGGYGPAIFYARKDWHATAAWPLVGWLSVPDQTLWNPFPDSERTPEEHGFRATGAVFRTEPSVLEAGGGVWATLFALDAALTIHEGVGVDTTRAHVMRLQGKLRSTLRSRGFVPNAPDDVTHLSGICTVGVEGDPKEAVRALLKAGVVTTSRGGGVRISTHVFNDEEDLDKLFHAIDSAGIKPWKP